MQKGLWVNKRNALTITNSLQLKRLKEKVLILTPMHCSLLKTVSMPSDQSSENARCMNLLHIIFDR